MLSLERIPDQVGYLVLTEDGAVQASGGELENDEKSANIIMGLIGLTESVDPAVFAASSIRKISINYDEHSYIICLSNKKIYVVKRRPKKSPTEIDSERFPVLA